MSIINEYIKAIVEQISLVPQAPISLAPTNSWSRGVDNNEDETEEEDEFSDEEKELCF